MNVEALLRDGSIVLLALVTISAVSIIVGTLRNGVVPMPTSPRVRAEILELLRLLSLEPPATVVELGSGWGSLSLPMSRELSAMAVIGYENSPVPFLASNAVRWFLRASNLRIVKADFHRVSLREADVVVCYLSPEAMDRLQPKLARELKPTAVVISSTFALRAWKPTRTVVVDDLYHTCIYVYYVGICRSNETGMLIDIREPLSDA